MFPEDPAAGFLEVGWCFLGLNVMSELCGKGFCVAGLVRLGQMSGSLEYGWDGGGEGRGRKRVLKKHASTELLPRERLSPCLCVLSLIHSFIFLIQQMFVERLFEKLPIQCYMKKTLH